MLQTPNKIKAIIFDLGNVLIKVDFERMLINQSRQNLGGSAHEIMESAYNDDLFKKYCKGKMDSRSFHQKLIQRFKLNLNYDAFAKKWCDIFEPVEDMANLLSDLSKRYTIGLLSDTDPLHWKYVLGKYTFLQSIKNPTLSFETGYMKPHPEIYRIAAKNVNQKADECLFIDDRLINVEGALKYGMKAVQFLDIYSLKQQFKCLSII